MSASNEDRVGLFYRSFTDTEAAYVHEIKERGQEFLNLIESLGASEETHRAKARVEEAVMWAVKHVGNHSIG